jgi:type IV fimbrial biogenesis protein FimT
MMNTPATTHSSRHQGGFTLVESCVAMAVTILSLGIAVPGFEQARERRHLEGAAAQLETDLQFARSLAVARNESVRVGFESKPEGTCYVLHTGAAGECSCGVDGTATCSAGGQALRAVRFAAGDPVMVTSNSRSMLFDASKGTVTPTGTLQVQSNHGKTVKLVINIMGRVRSCSPNGQVVGYKPC